MSGVLSKITENFDRFGNVALGTQFRHLNVHFTNGSVCIHLNQKRLSSELLHCVLRTVAYPDRKAPWM